MNFIPLSLALLHLNILDLIQTEPGNKRFVTIQWFTEPPSITTHWPVIKSLSGDARKSSAPTRSSGTWRLFNARVAVLASTAASSKFSCVRTFSLITRPGAKLLTQMLSSPTSRARQRVIVITAPFEVT